MCRETVGVYLGTEGDAEELFEVVYAPYTSYQLSSTNLSLVTAFVVRSSRQTQIVNVSSRSEQQTPHDVFVHSRRLRFTAWSILQYVKFYLNSSHRSWCVHVYRTVLFLSLRSPVFFPILSISIAPLL